MSTERIVVDDKVADEFVARFAAKAKSLSVGDPREGKAILGSVVDHAAAERVTSLVLDAVAKGAKLVAGGSISGTLIGAHVLDHVTPAMRIYDEELFGPVTTVVRAKGEDEAVRIANDTPYGLSSAVFSRDSPAPSRWRAGSRPASATSTARRCTTRRRCRSAA